MSTCACVLSKNGERLMPTIRLGKVRHLLKDGKAKIIKHHARSAIHQLTIKKAASSMDSVKI